MSGAPPKPPPKPPPKLSAKPPPGPPDWLEANRANWDERVGVHLGAEPYDLGPLRAGRGALHPIEEAEPGPVDGLDVVHLQYHFGRDGMTLAQRGARVTGVDFSSPAIEAARGLAAELGLSARFVLSDVHGAPEALGGETFDRVFTTWGTIGWLPGIGRRARVVAARLRPGGRLRFADGHPAAMVFDGDAPEGPGGFPGPLAPYFERGPVVLEDPRDYADPEARLASARTVEWVHPVGRVVTALIEAGMRLDWLHEHDGVPWRMFGCLVEARPAACIAGPTSPGCRPPCR